MGMYPAWATQNGNTRAQPFAECQKTYKNVTLIAFPRLRLSLAPLGLSCIPSSTPTRSESQIRSENILPPAKKLNSFLSESAALRRRPLMSPHYIRNSA